MNPYWNLHFFQCIALFFRRLFTGEISLGCADELQVFTLILLSLSCGLIGPFLVLKKMAMFANSLSHTILVGLISAFLLLSRWSSDPFNWATLFVGAFFAALLTAFFTEALIRLFRLSEDASIGLVFTALFAAGILLVTLYTKNIHFGIEMIMGNVDALHPKDFSRALFLAAFNSSAILIFYRRLEICSFDAPFAKALKIASGRYQFLILFLAAITILGAFRAVGVILVLAFLLFPYLTAKNFSTKLSRLLLWTPLVGMASSLISVFLARHLLSVYDLALSTGALTVTLMGTFYFLSFLPSLKRKRSVRIESRRS